MIGLKAPPRESHNHSLRFGGYDARPLKAIYTQPMTTGDLFVARQLQCIGEREKGISQQQTGSTSGGFNVHVHFTQPPAFKTIRRLISGKTPEWSGRLMTQLYDALKLVRENNQNSLMPYSRNNLSCWGQDCKAIVQDPNNQETMLILPELRITSEDMRAIGSPQGKMLKRGEQQAAKNLAQLINIRTREIKSYLEWGNVFLGNKPNGQAYALIGEDSVNVNALNIAGSVKKYRQNPAQYQDLARKQILEDLNLKPENLHIISQPAGHIDLGIRVLNYPYVLVNDFDLSLKALATELKKPNLNEYERDRLQNLLEATRLHQRDNVSSPEYMKKFGRSGPYVSADQTVAELTAQGFQPIRVPGIFGYPYSDGQEHYINFMNSNLHQRPDKSLVYMTNGSGYTRLNEIFQEALNASVNHVSQVDFITGNSGERSGVSHLEKMLAVNSGGLHCMSTEHPNFSMTGENIQD